MIYVDNAATSFPKPPQVLRAMARCLREAGGNPGRSGHQLSRKAAEVVFRAREAVAELVNVPDSRQIIFTPNATAGLNLVLMGMLKRGDHVVTTSMEHNSVMRPLRYLEAKRGVHVSVVKCRKDGSLPLARLRGALNEKTKLVVVNHVSNVTGVIHPLGKIRVAIGGIPLAVDGAQSVGVLPVDVQEAGVDFLAFTGHKSLMGPPGIGGVYMRNGFLIEPLMRGGTGSRSESEEHPDFLPDRYECGTHNTVGLAGLHGGIRFVRKHGLGEIRRHEMALAKGLLQGLSHIDGVVVYGPKDLEARSAIVSFNVRGFTPSEVSYALDRRYGILARGGLHCAPAAHRTVGTFPEGTVRLSLGFFNTKAEVGQILRAVGDIARSSRVTSRALDRIEEVR